MINFGYVSEWNPNVPNLIILKQYRSDTGYAPHKSMNDDTKTV